MTARPKVFLHIGEPKTGTTFVQEVMWSNRVQLAEAGVLLPGRSIRDHLRATQDLRDELRLPNDPAGAWHGEWDVLAREAMRAPHAAVISHELFCAATADQAARAVQALDDAELHVILSVRDIATLVPAEWQETVKHRNQRPWEQWLSAVIDEESDAADRRRWGFWRVHDTMEILKAWSKNLPAEQVHVVTMPPRGRPHTLLWERFAKILDIDPSVVDTARARPNASLGVAEIELLRALNKELGNDLPGWFYMRNVKEQLAHGALAARATTGRLMLPAARNEWAQAEAETLIRSLRDSNYDIVGDLEELRPVPTTTRGAHPDDVGAEEVRDAAVAALGALLRAQFSRATARNDPRAAGLGGGAIRVVQSSPRMKRTLGRLMQRYPSVARLRVAAWRVIENRPRRF